MSKSSEWGFGQMLNPKFETNSNVKNTNFQDTHCLRKTALLHHIEKINVLNLVLRI